MRRRWSAYAAIAIVIVLVAADLTYWNWAASRMRDGIRAWIADRTAEGWQIQTAPLAISGWPNAVIAELRDVRITDDHGARSGSFPAPLHFTSAAIMLRTSLLQPTTLTLTLLGEQHIAVADAPPLVLAGDLMQADLPLTDGADPAVTFTGRGLRLWPAVRTWTARIAAADGRIAVANTDDAPPAYDFSASADTIELPAAGKYPLGPSIHDLSISGTLRGPFPPGRTLAASAGAWRDGGGSLEVKQAVLNWGPLNLTSTATLALDDQLQPMGSGSAKVSGYEDALDRLAAAGVLTKSAATVAKAMLSLLAGTGTGDVPSEVDVPLTLQYRTLSMRQVPLVRLPELDWPQP
jgi:hypothetical protein